MSRRPVALAVTAVLSAVTLSACGTGLQAQTYKERRPYESTNAELDRLALRNLALEAVSEEEGAPEGGGALLTGVIVNEGEQDDALVAVQTDIARDIQLVSEAGAPQLDVPAGRSTGTEWQVQLSGLTREVRVGEYVSVTLEFAKAGRTTVQVPVRAGDNGLEEREVAQNPYGEGEGGEEGEAEGGSGEE